MSGMTEAEELAALRRLQELESKAGGQPAPEPGWWDKVTDMVPNAVKNVGTAAYKGVAALGAGAADAFAGSYDLTDAVAASMGQPVRKLDTSSPVSKALEATGYQPKTATEKFINSGVKGATGALLSPSGMVGPLKAAVTGGLAGLGSEAGGKLTEGSAAEPYARIVGALMGGVAGGVGTMPFKNSRELAREALLNIPESKLDAAKATMARGQKVGVPMNLDQALGEDTNVTNVVKALVSRKEGQPVVEQLRQQPAQVKSLASRMGAALPGQVKEPAVVANETQGAATDVMKAAREAQANATRPLYQAAGNLESDFVQNLSAQVKRLAQEFPETNKGKLFGELADVIDSHIDLGAAKPTGLLGANGQPIMGAATPVSAEKLNDSLRSFMTNLKSVHANSKAGDREAVGATRALVKDLRESIGDVSPNFKAANALHAQISTDVIDPLKKGVIGRVMGATGELADKEAVNKILPILAKGRNPEAKTSEILQFAELTKGTPEVFQDAVRTHFSNVVSAAEKQLHGQMSPNLAAEIERGLLGNADQRQGWKDALQGVAKAQGAEPNLLYKGFMNGMKIISAAAKRPGALGPDGTELEAIARDSKAAGALKMIGLAPGKPIARGLENMLSGEAYRTLAANLTTPEGVKKLQELAKMNYLSPKAQALISTMMAAEATKNTQSPGLQNRNSGGNGD